MYWCKFNINDISDNDYKYFFSLMNSEKRERIDRFKNTEDKKRSVCAEMLARQEISKNYGFAIEEIMFDTQENGKPYCKNADVHLSLSHSGEYAVCAIGDADIGIDIQKIVPYNEKTAKKVCSESEFEHIEKSDDKAAEFVKLWTQKEAFAKMEGKGICRCDIKNCLVGRKTVTLRFSDYFVSICEKR